MKIKLKPIKWKYNKDHKTWTIKSSIPLGICVKNDEDWMEIGDPDKYAVCFDYVGDQEYVWTTDKLSEAKKFAIVLLEKAILKMVVLEDEHTLS